MSQFPNNRQAPFGLRDTAEQEIRPGTDAELNATAQIVSALLSNPNNRTDQSALPGIINEVRASLSSPLVLGDAPSPELKPAVPVKRSVTPDHIICLEDGKKFKSLKRHLQSHYNMTPDEYRQKWGLPNDYPMVAPNYAEARSELAKRMGLGVRRKEEPAPVVTKSKPKVGTKSSTSKARNEAAS